MMDVSEKLPQENKKTFSAIFDILKFRRFGLGVVKKAQLLTTACRVHPPSGDTHLGGGLDTNGSTESFELVTEENNGDGKPKTDGRNSAKG